MAAATKNPSATDMLKRAGAVTVTKGVVKSKRCSKCGETKPAGEFPRNRRHRTGLGSQCKACIGAGARERRITAQQSKGKTPKAAPAAAATPETFSEAVATVRRERAKRAKRSRRRKGS